MKGAVMKDKDLKNKVKNLAAELALQEAERTGKDYKECISSSLDEACIRLDVNRKEFIKMFI
jgi:hypothetical protein